MALPQCTPDSSFSTQKINPSTFLIIEDDKYSERPYIYVKIHPRAPVLLLCDTGCDEPSEAKRNARFTHLRPYLENAPVPANNNQPLNPGSSLQYIIICTHCHYDHINGITQFADGHNTSIIASSAGRDFIESDLDSHGLFKDIGAPVPCYKVTAWAQSFDKIYFDPATSSVTLAPNPTFSSPTHLIDLGITIIQTPGHTPDELAWYDDDEMHLYVGDSLYEEGKEGMPIEWPGEGNMIEWVFSMMKLRAFVRRQNARAALLAEAESEIEGMGDGAWLSIARRAKLGAGHQTHSADAEEIMEKLDESWERVLGGEVPVVRTKVTRGEVYCWWRESGGGAERMSYYAPKRLMDEARCFFGKGLDGT